MIRKRGAPFGWIMPAFRLLALSTKIKITAEFNCFSPVLQ